MPDNACTEELAEKPCDIGTAYIKIDIIGVGDAHYDGVECLRLLDLSPNECPNSIQAKVLAGSEIQQGGSTVDLTGNDFGIS